MPLFSDAAAAPQACGGGRRSGEGRWVGEPSRWQAAAGGGTPEGQIASARCRAGRRSAIPQRPVAVYEQANMKNAVPFKSQQHVVVFTAAVLRVQSRRQPKVNVETDTYMHMA